MTKQELTAATVMTCWPYSSREALLGPPGEGGLVVVETPTLAGIGVRRTSVHRKIAPMFRRFLALVEDCGLTNRILTWDGTYNDRTVRGSSSTRSTHAWGAAFDINYEWNQFEHTPAQLGQKGCVRELVGIAQKCGFAWGGHYRTPDGMHFEPYRLMAEEELPTLDLLTADEVAARQAGYKDRIHPHLAALYSAIPAVLPAAAGSPSLTALNQLNDTLKAAHCKD